MMNNCIKKKKNNSFSLFLRLATSVQSKWERESQRGYEGIQGFDRRYLQLLARVLPWHLNMAVFIHTVWQFTSGQATKISSFWLATLVLFASGLLSTISVVLHLGHLISHFNVLVAVWVLWHINPCRSFNAIFCLYIHTYSTKDFKTNIKVGRIFY